MRTAMLVIAMAGCGGSTEPTQVLIDASIERPACVRYVCFDHTVWKLQPQPVDERGFCPPPDYNGVEEFAHCEYGCRNDAVTQGDPYAGCLPRPLTPFVCEASGSCAAAAEMPCTEVLGCELSVTFGTCQCPSGSWECSPMCSDGLCGAAAVQAAIAGTWTGTIDKTTAIPATYPNVTLSIGGDGDWQLAGSDELLGQWGTGIEPGTTIFVQGQTATGGIGTMRMQGSFTDALMHGVRVQGDRLQATIEMHCLHTYVLDLQRVQ